MVYIKAMLKSFPHIVSSELFVLFLNAYVDAPDLDTLERIISCK